MHHVPEGTGEVLFYRRYMKTLNIAFIFITSFIFIIVVSAQDNKQVYWGDTHLHTSYSGDAFAVGNEVITPDLAYRFAKGLPVSHPYHKARVQLQRPLDFLVVSDHAEYMGTFNLISKNSPLINQSELGKQFIDYWKKGKKRDIFYEVAKTLNDRNPIKKFLTPDIIQPIWNSIIQTADEHNEPGLFTAFIGWEWSSLPNGNNLHRVVMMRDGAETAANFLPYSSLSSDKPEDLWTFLQTTSKKYNTDFVAIPHNSNISSGLMFNTKNSDGKPIDADYSTFRMRWEPVVEMTQVKGDSETHPDLSPEDEFADFESFNHLMRFGTKDKSPAAIGDYARSALRRGLSIGSQAGVNPYQFGMIGSSDIHSGLSSVDETNFFGKYGVDSTPYTKDIQLTPGAVGIDMGAQGVAAVWATENTRQAIFEAFKRREVYATTGPRIQLQFFGGWNFKKSDVNEDRVAIGNSKGVPMGSMLSASYKNKAPAFLVAASKDPLSANLDRIQIVKAWVDGDHKTHEKVYNVTASNSRKIVNNKLEAVGSTVNIEKASYSNDIGAKQLAIVWTDPDFNPKQAAFYYARVLEIPTPRHSLLDAVALKQTHSDNHPAIIQERAYSSPIWYRP